MYYISAHEDKEDYGNSDISLDFLTIKWFKNIIYSIYLITW